MGVYIKGMEMPKVGSAYVLVIHPDGTITTVTGGRELPYKAIPVPCHGDLIDRNALFEKHYGRYGAIDAVAREAIKNFPAIIPASE